MDLAIEQGRSRGVSSHDHDDGPGAVAAPGALRPMRKQGDRLPTAASLPLRREGHVLMAQDLMLYQGGARRLSRDMRQTLAVQQYTAQLHAGKVRAVAECAELALLSIASLSNLEAQLITAVPLAERRLESLVNTAAAVMAAQISRLAWEL